MPTPLTPSQQSHLLVIGATAKRPWRPPGHPLHDHDVRHVRTYQDILSHKIVADLIRTAATTALPKPDLCEKFSGAIDGLGDAMNGLEQGLAAMGTVRAARLSLRKLVYLADGVKFDKSSVFAPEEFEASPPEQEMWRLLGVNDQNHLVRTLRYDEQYPRDRAMVSEKYDPNALHLGPAERAILRSL